MRRYGSELSELRDTYLYTAKLVVPEAVDVVREINCGPVVFLGTGGTSAVAALAADEHTRRTGYLAAAMTPVHFVAGSSETTRAAVVAFSARARHPDVAIALRAARSRSTGPVVLVTQRNADELKPELRAIVDRVATIPTTTPDGFLATNSLLAMATSWVVAAGYQLPDDLGFLKEVSVEPLAAEIRRVAIVYAPEHRMAAIDFETRLAESGVADAQVADLRNIAHGRHVGLAQDPDATALIVLTGPEGADLAERTIELLPHTRQAIVVRTDDAFPAGALDTLAAGMQMFGELAHQRGIDPGRPHVPQSGRRLYHLKWARHYGLVGDSSSRSTAVRRKLQAASMSLEASAIADLYANRLDRWLQRAAAQSIRAVVVDYDGTCCTTANRLNPLTSPVTSGLLRLLDAGIELGFASGRGRSLHTTLRQWIPVSQWAQVHVGMYNGGLVQRLDSEMPPRTESVGVLAELVLRVESALTGFDCSLAGRDGQLTIEFTDGGVGAAMIGGVESIVRSVVVAHAGTEYKVCSSGHSLDVIPATSSKVSVIDAVDCAPDEILAVGDRGDVGGNDFELLAAAGIGLSVDHVSADPDRCWNLAAAGRSGPQALTDYLGVIDTHRGGVRIRPADLL